MIYNQWYIILDSKELNKKPIGIKRLNENLALWRDKDGKACCISDICCHRGAALSKGKLVNSHLECPFHGFLFDSQGKVKLIPANGKAKPVPEAMKVKYYRVYENYGFIFIWWGDSEKATDKPAFFEELSEYSYSGFYRPWQVHYSRAIENQLDVVHVPFVHKTTIGRGNKTLVNGPVVKVNENRLIFYVNNVPDDGKTIAKKPGEIKDYQNFFRLSFIFPNYWQNYISDKIRAFAAFVPVDEENTIIYIRYYQNLIRIPVLKQLMNFAGKISSIIILNQDKRVVITQLPKKSRLSMGEHLIPGDKPILEYRKIRQKLIEINNPAEI
ncbi:MAG: aromatic ring-hydroxylating dioxygenase subunit alpha [Bacteroidales bacterium]